MKRLAKHEGYGNVVLEEVPVPAITPDQVLVKAHTSLISRGSEILARYRKDGPVDARIMGYSLAGTVVEVGERARAAGFKEGDRVFALSPHAEYVACTPDADLMRVLRLPDATPWHRAPFQALARGGVAWAIASRALPEDTVAVLGQGLVGNLVMQAHRIRRGDAAGRVIAVDSVDLRVERARALGADVAVHAGQADPVEEVRRLTASRGADVVVDCVGGPAGVRSFEQALEMVKADGIVHLVGLYHGQPLALDASKIQRKMLIGGYHLPESESQRAISERAAALIAAEQIRVDPLITHRVPASAAPAAFRLLDEHPEAALGVLLEWPQ